jgi:hypothetical protein
MPQHLDHWKWNSPSFAEWCEAANHRLLNVYMITIEDAGVDEADLKSSLGD